MEANTEHTRVRVAAVVTGESGGGSVLSGTRGKATAVSRAGRENSETVAKRYAEATAFTRPSLG